MVGNTLSVTAFVLCLSLFLVYRVNVFKDDFRKLQGDIIRQLNQPLTEGPGDGRVAKMSKTLEEIKSSAFQQTQKHSPISSLRRWKREQNICGAVKSFLQFTANTEKQPYVRGNVTVIPWTVAVQQGQAISPKENKLVVQEDGYYMVFGQVLFQSQGTVMGHVIQRQGSGIPGMRSTELLRCVKVMPRGSHDITCFTEGIVKLEREDEVELVIPSRPEALISMDSDATFFGIMQLN